MLKLGAAITASLTLFGTSACTAVQPAEPPSPKHINSHMHAAPLGRDDAAYREHVLAEMDAHDIGYSVLHLFEPADVAVWLDGAPGRFLAGPVFPCWHRDDGTPFLCDWDGSAFPDIDWLRTQYETGAFEIMGELTFNYAGIGPDDPRMAPYWALAAEHDIPVAVHINPGPPAGSRSRPEGCCPHYDEEIGNPDGLRPVLARHPDLRVWLQHAGMPLTPAGGPVYDAETLALLDDYPNVYVDMSILNAIAPAELHADVLRRFIERGHADRIMMGTDNVPAAPIFARYESFDFLTEAQRDAILGGNARRFFAPELARREDG